MGWLHGSTALHTCFEHFFLVRRELRTNVFRLNVWRGMRLCVHDTFAQRCTVNYGCTGPHSTCRFCSAFESMSDFETRNLLDEMKMLIGTRQATAGGMPTLSQESHSSIRRLDIHDFSHSLYRALRLQP